VRLPQYDWGSPAFQEEAEKIVRFWMDTGIDGMVIDAVNWYVGCTWELNRRRMTDVIASYGNAYAQPEGAGAFREDPVAWITEGGWNSVQDYGLGIWWEKGTNVIERAIESGDPRPLEGALRAYHDRVVEAGGSLYFQPTELDDEPRSRLAFATLATLGALVQVEYRPDRPLDAEKRWLLETKAAHPALHQLSRRRRIPTAADDKHYAFLRTAADGDERVLVVLNFQKEAQEVSLDLSGLDASTLVDVKTGNGSYGRRRCGCRSCHTATACWPCTGNRQTVKPVRKPRDDPERARWTGGSSACRSRRRLSPAYLMLGIWILLQFVSGIGEVARTEQTGVAYMAHIGGFVAGLLLVKFFAAGGHDRDAGRRSPETITDGTARPSRTLARAGLASPQPFRAVGRDRGRPGRSRLGHPEEGRRSWSRRHGPERAAFVGGLKALIETFTGDWFRDRQTPALTAGNVAAARSQRASGRVRVQGEAPARVHLGEALAWTCPACSSIPRSEGFHDPRHLSRFFEPPAFRARARSGGRDLRQRDHGRGPVRRMLAEGDHPHA
jgi:hypothetical protein